MANGTDIGESSRPLPKSQPIRQPSIRRWAGSESRGSVLSRQEVAGKGKGVVR